MSIFKHPILSLKCFVLFFKHDNVVVFLHYLPSLEDHKISLPNIYPYFYYCPWPPKIGHAHDLDKISIPMTFTTKPRKPSPRPSQ
jgi:hypothetical protein